VTSAVNSLCRCEDEREVSVALPGLIRDLHTSIAAGRDVAELLPLSVWLHTQVTVPWLQLAGASLDLCSQAIQLAYQAAREHDTPPPLALAAVAGTRLLLEDGAFDLAQAGLDAVTVSTNTPESMQLAGFFALRQSRIAAIDSRPGDADAALEHAGELATRTGEGNAYGLGFGPVNVGMFRVFGAVDAKDYEQAVNVAESLNPKMHANRSQRANYWTSYGRALTRVRRRDDAVMALRRAELISPHRVQRDPIVRDVLGELLTCTRRNSPAGRALRRMAYRAGLPV
jgi:tetratricopeptide (TPR) repeat protein